VDGGKDGMIAVAATRCGVLVYRTLLPRRSFGEGLTMTVSLPHLQKSVLYLSNLHSHHGLRPGHISRP